ncbi:MAG TPA: TROVE domain-containing protein [Ignavibacteriaceae bacterium]
MSRFNTATSPKTKTTNLAGGQAYSQSPELELVSILLTSFANDQFYRSANDTFETLKTLIAKCDKKLVAQAAVYARTKFGMRSISHVVASELGKYISGQKWAKDFYNAVIYRPDDMLEIISYHIGKKEKLPASMKKGLAKAFDKFDKYALAKYRGEGKDFSLVDVVNIIHPKPTEKNKEALAALVKGELKSFDTWETELTKAGQVAETEEQKDDLKKDAWEKLIKEKKIGYFALLRNLRNIIEQAPEVVPQALELLVNENLIKKSLVLPFRFTTAYEEIAKLNSGAQVRNTLVALNKAVDISVSNVPKFDGDTLVVLDESGSMSGKPAQIGSLFAAVLVKSNNADLITFSDRARYQNVNPMDSTITITKGIKFSSGGTNFHSIFQTANKKYDRIVILSDMQGWIGHDTPKAAYNQYKQATGANPFIYSFDLNSYGSMQFPEQNVFALAGFSEKVFDIMKLMEQDKKALISEIKKIEF